MKNVSDGAFHGSARDAAIVHRSVAGVLYAVCEYEINRVVVDADIKNGRWRTDSWDASCSHAVDIMDDWLIHGTGTAGSLMDIIRVHVGHLKMTAASTPEWHFRLEDTVVREGRRIPRMLDRGYHNNTAPLWLVCNKPFRQAILGVVASETMEKLSRSSQALRLPFLSQACTVIRPSFVKTKVSPGGLPSLSIYTAVNKFVMVAAHTPSRRGITNFVSPV